MMGPVGTVGRSIGKVWIEDDKHRFANCGGYVVVEITDITNLSVISLVMKCFPSPSWR